MDTAEFPLGGGVTVPSPREWFVGIHHIVPKHMMGCLGQEVNSIVFLCPFQDIHDSPSEKAWHKGEESFWNAEGMLPSKLIQFSDIQTKSPPLTARCGPYS